MIVIRTSLPRTFFRVWSVSIWPFIFIAPDRATDTALIAHEKVHGAEQLRQLVVIWWLRYLLSSSFRLAAELRAYKVQISLGGCTVEQAAFWIANIYRLDITADKVKELLLK